MTLQQVIDFLKTQDQTKVVHGFAKAHSYRGYYEFIAFEPELFTKISDMLIEAEAAIGQTYCGWKGGEYTMSGDTPVYRAFKGCLSHDDCELSESVLKEICDTPVFVL